MSGEGFKMAMTLIICFAAIAITGMYLISAGKADVATLKEYFIGLGVLAVLFGVPSIITSWVQTRGQTSESQIIEAEPLKYETFVGSDTKGD